MKISLGSILWVGVFFASCSSVSSTINNECVPGEPVVNENVCATCVCTAQGTIECTGLDVGTSCSLDDCCVANTTCQPCTGPDCPAGDMICQGEAVLVCEGQDGCTLSTPLCEDGECSCTDVTLPDGSSCIDDPNACTAGDTCQEGVCVAGEPAELEDGNPCTVGACVKGEIQQKALEGSCTDGNPCTVGDRCVLGQCLPESLVECPEQVCGQGVCDPVEGSCVYEDLADGIPCLSEEGCGGVGVCASGLCEVDGPSCEDNNPCTIDSCVDEGSCTYQNEADGTQCNDPSSCIENGLCSNGVCVADGQSPCVVDEACKNRLMNLVKTCLNPDSKQCSMAGYFHGER